MQLYLWSSRKPRYCRGTDACVLIKCCYLNVCNLYVILESMYAKTIFPTQVSMNKIHLTKTYEIVPIFRSYGMSMRLRLTSLWMAAMAALSLAIRTCWVSFNNSDVEEGT